MRVRVWADGRTLQCEHNDSVGAVAAAATAATTSIVGIVGVVVVVSTMFL